MTSSNNSNHFTSSDSNFGWFHSPPPSSRPRLVKVRKQSASNHPRSSNTFTFGGSGTRVADLESNPFQPSSYAATSTSILGNTNATNVGSSSTFLFGVDSSSKIEKSSFTSGSSRSTAVNVGGKAENLISDELRKLKVGIGAEDASDQLQMGQPSNEMPFHNFSNTKHSDPQQSGAQDKNLSGLHIPPDCEYGETKLHDTTSSSMSASFSSNNYQPVWNDFYASSMNRPEKVEFPFTSRLDSMGTPHVEFKTPNMKGNLFSGASSKLEAKKGYAKDPKLKKKKGKLRKPTADPMKLGQEFVSRESSQENPESYASLSVEFFPLSGSSTFPSPRQGKKGDVSSSLSRNGDKSEPVKEQGKEKIIPNSTGSTKAQEACEKWRLSGNQAYDTGDLSKAEDYYTQGLNSVSQSETSRSCLRALMLCYSNRAATRMSLGRMREALKDCLMAAGLDPNFLKVQVRAANCYLALGEVEDALLHYMKCLQSGSDVCADRKVLVEASEGLEKAQKVSDNIIQSTELLRRKTPEDIELALKFIDEALGISSSSEQLLEMKADALLMLRKYEQVIHLCEQTLASAEMNSPTYEGENNSSSGDGSTLPRSSFSKLWRLSLIVKSYFYLGRLEEALDFVKKQEDSDPLMGSARRGSMREESVIHLADTVRELLSRKAAGNEAFQSGKHAEAVEHYTAALSCNVESRPFTAICFCNRAAAYRAMGQITDAIADCSLAIALDGNYLKAISRRAGLFEMIRDYGQSATDYQRLVTLLTKQVEEKVNRSGASDKLSYLNELRQNQQRLSIVEEEDRKEIPLNMYLIMGVEPSAAASEIKKAYRKAALKHHPDKAGQSLARSENGDDGIWREIAEEVHKDTDRLFKMIAEAYAVLSNPTKRSQYDQEEEMRKEATRFARSGASRMYGDAQNYPFERSGNRRQWQEVWRQYSNSQSRGPERTRTSR